MNRRHFVAASAGGIVATQLARELPLANASEPLQSGIPNGKNPLLKLVAADPLVLETPSSLLAASRVTPSSDLFVRNHHGAKQFSDMNPRPMEGDLEIVGLVDKPIRYPISELSRLPLTEVEMVLQCSGNNRAQFSKLSPIKGTPWTNGGIGNVRFAGVRMSELIKAIGLNVRNEAKYLTAEGADQPEKLDQSDYEKSVPWDVALARGLLVTKLNREALPALHGGPLRFVIPGYYGNVQVKWLTRLRFEARETNNYFQLPDYRTPKRLIAPGEAVEYTFDNSDPNYDMKINSRIFAPVDGASITANKIIRVQGVAWNDGAAALTAVELSRDMGKTWVATELATSAGPFAFREWSTQMQFERGEHSLWVRAIDAHGRTQPLDGGLFWNQGGYGWNGIERISFQAVVW